MLMRILRITILLTLVIIVAAAILAVPPVNPPAVHAFTTPADAAKAVTATTAETTTAAAAKDDIAIKASSKSNIPAKPSSVSLSKTGIKPLKQILTDKGINPVKANMKIAVDKSAHTLGVIFNGILLKSYHMELGDNGLGDKNIAGDHKTPEGTFYISEKSVLNPADVYLGSRWMELSYPNIEDADRGLVQGLISQKTHDSIETAINQGIIPPQSTALGGGVGIHGGSTKALGSNWTWGCVGLTNSDVEDFYNYVKIGTQVIIQK